MYITNYNLERVIKVTEMTPNQLIEDIEHRLKNNLSQDELKSLNDAKGFFENHKELMSDIKRREVHHLPQPKDSYTKLWKERAPAYHLNSKCPSLNSKYLNYYIPKEVQSKGIQEVERFRKFVKTMIENGHKLEDDSTILTIKAEFNFGDLHFGKQESDNSGSADFGVELSSHMTQEDIDKQIENTLIKLCNFAHTSNLHKQIYNIRFRTPHKIRQLIQYKSDEQKRIANELTKLKEVLILTLIESFKKANSFDQSSIEEELLKTLGFVPCSKCLSNLNNPFINPQDVDEISNLFV